MKIIKQESSFNLGNLYFFILRICLANIALKQVLYTSSCSQHHGGSKKSKRNRRNSKTNRSKTKKRKKQKGGHYKEVLGFLAFIFLVILQNVQPTSYKTDIRYEEGTIHKGISLAEKNAMKDELAKHSRGSALFNDDFRCLPVSLLLAKMVDFDGFTQVLNQVTSKKIYDSLQFPITISLEWFKHQNINLSQAFFINEEEESILDSSTLKSIFDQARESFIPTDFYSFPINNTKTAVIALRSNFDPDMGHAVTWYSTRISETEYEDIILDSSILDSPQKFVTLDEFFDQYPDQWSNYFVMIIFSDTILEPRMSFDYFLKEFNDQFYRTFRTTKENFLENIKQEVKLFQHVMFYNTQRLNDHHPSVPLSEIQTMQSVLGLDRKYIKQDSKWPVCNIIKAEREKRDLIKYDLPESAFEISTTVKKLCTIIVDNITNVITDLKRKSWYHIRVPTFHNRETAIAFLKRHEFFRIKVAENEKYLHEKEFLDTVSSSIYSYSVLTILEIEGRVITFTNPNNDYEVYLEVKEDGTFNFMDIKIDIIAVTDKPPDDLPSDSILYFSAPSYDKSAVVHVPTKHYSIVDFYANFGEIFEASNIYSYQTMYQELPDHLRPFFRQIIEPTDLGSDMPYTYSDRIRDHAYKRLIKGEKEEDKLRVKSKDPNCV